jgi:hypothetical protein
MKVTYNHLRVVFFINLNNKNGTKINKLKLSLAVALGLVAAQATAMYTYSFEITYYKTSAMSEKVGYWYQGCTAGAGPR